MKMKMNTNTPFRVPAGYGIAVMLLVFSVGLLAAQESAAPAVSADPPAASGEAPAVSGEAAAARQLLEGSVGRIVRVKTVGRGEFQGRVRSVTTDRVELQDGEGLILQVASDQIVEVQVIEAGRAGTYYQDAASNKLIIIPLGFGMEPGELHISNQEIIAVNVSYGLSERISFWGGLSIPGLLLNARASFLPNERTGISVGALGVVTFFETIGVALPYVIASFGTVNENFTAGVGIPLAYGGGLGTDVDFATGGALVLGGKKVLTQNASIITENWVVGMTEYSGGSFGRPGFVAFPMVALRIASSRFSWDVGITMPVSFSPAYDTTWEGVEPREEYLGYDLDWLLGVAIPIPILAFTYRIQ